MIENPPCGLDEIYHVFGDCDDPDFEEENIVPFKLPYPLQYDGKQVTKSRCHRLAVENFQGALQRIMDQGLKKYVLNYGGIYVKRNMRGRPYPSTHSWGIAIDIEPQKFPLGSKEKMIPSVVEIFHDFGFVYGGDFRSRKDPMHFQLCTNY